METLINDNGRIRELKKHIEDVAKERSEMKEGFFKKDKEVQNLEKELNDAYVCSLLGGTKSLVGLCYKKVYDSENTRFDDGKKTTVARYLKIIKVDKYHKSNLFMTVAAVVPNANSFRLIGCEVEQISTVIDNVVSNEEYNEALAKVCNFMHDLAQDSDVKNMPEKKYLQFYFT